MMSVFRLNWILQIVVILIYISVIQVDSTHYSGCTCGKEPSSKQLNIVCDSNETLTYFIISRCIQEPDGVTRIAVTLNSASSHDRSLKIDSETFSAFPNLLSISLSSLNLNYLPPLLFTFLPLVREIDLSNNRLSKLPKDLFLSQYDSLERLNLSRNYISDLPLDFFDELPQLRVIDLSHNQLTALPQNAPVQWPKNINLILLNTSLPPCWDIRNKSSLIKQDVWWCDNYSLEVDGDFLEKVQFPCNNLKDVSSDSTVYWYSPKRTFYKSDNDSSWKLLFITHWEPSSVSVSDKTGGSKVSIDKMRPYFNGVWSCLIFQSKDNNTVVNVVSQVMLQCRSMIRSTYHWSLIVSAACTIVMILAGLLSALIRVLWLTRCFTRKVHVVSALSLHDLQYSPRLAEQRIKILRRDENRNRQPTGDGSVHASFSSFESVIPSWLPPHRQRSVDPFAHGGGPVTSDEETDSMLDHPRACSSDDDLAEDEEDDTMECDDHRTRSRMDELTERLRKDVVKRVDNVKTRMRERRHTMEESTSKVMRSLRSGSSVAASKMRSGLHNSVESMKFKVKAVTDFCGGGSAGLGQTVSVATLDTDLDTETTVERRIADVTAV